MPALQSAWMFERDHPDRRAAVAYACATACDLAYSRVQRWIDLFAAWGGFADKGFVVTPRDWIPNYAYWLDPRGAIVSITGTENFEQIQTYLLTSCAVAGGADFNARIWEAPLEMYRAIRTEMAARLQSLPPATPIIFTGHSLGAVVAVLLALHFQAQGRLNVRHCVTLAAPKLGGPSTHSLVTDLPLTAWRLLEDQVPLWPPSLTSPRFSPLFLLPGFYNFDYEELTATWVLDQEGNLERRWQRYKEGGRINFEHQVRYHVIDLLLHYFHGTRLELNDYMIVHAIATYKERLFQLARRTESGYRIEGLLPLNNEIFQHALYGGIRRRSTIPDTSPAVLAFANPEAPPPADPLQVPIDPPQPVVVTSTLIAVEEISANTSRPAEAELAPAPPPNPLPPFDPLRFETGPRRDWLHKATDRRMLLKAWQVLLAIQARDAKLAEAQAQGRQLELPMILDPDDPKLLRAFADVLDQVELALSLHYA